MSLQLDERQRAMLKEMGITVWWPKPVVLAAEPAVAAPKAALPPVAKRSNNDEFEELKKIQIRSLKIVIQ